MSYTLLDMGALKPPYYVLANILQFSQGVSRVYETFPAAFMRRILL
jgi:hypothetical protein